MSKSESFQLKRISPPQNNKKILTIVMDGIGYINPNANITSEIMNQNGIAPSEAFLTGNAVNAAYTPNFQQLVSSSLFRTLKAHGVAVGLPSDEDMGNSEVGHNALGAGRVFAQGAKLVNSAISSGEIFKGQAWQKVVNRTELLNGQNSLHFCGLLSDGNVHSHIDHLFALINGAKLEGVKKVRLHILLDGRDVGPLTATDYIQKLEHFLVQINSNDFDCRVASGGGRTFVTMDRYESDWKIVERGYAAHVLGEGRAFPNLLNAVETLRKEKNYYDQDLPEFVIYEQGKPIGTVEDNDGFIFFNFRGDRAIEITRALTEKNFSSFTRKRFPKIFYAGMMQYDGDLKIPELFLVTPPAIDRTMSELLSNSSVRQFACSETQKYGHVTYFWNGNRSGKFNDKFENYVEISSDLVPFQERPWMKSAEIADETIKQMYANSFEIGRINFANGDMVGHSGDFTAAILSVSAVDLALGRIMKAAKETNTILVVVADHGNADEMFELDKKTKRVVLDKNGLPKVKTSHTLAPVPCAIYNAEVFEKNISFKKSIPNAGLANVASTILELAGFEAPSFYEESLIDIINVNLKKDTNNSNVNEKKVFFQINDYQERFLHAKLALTFADTVAQLRSPDGCPWDKEQTFITLQSYLIEEAYEVIEAINQLSELPSENQLSHFCEELGDVLLQIYLNSQIALDQKLFSINDVFKKINEKMISRHPHVFKNGKNNIKTADDVKNQWKDIKELENKEILNNNYPSLLNKALRKKALPTLNFGTEVSKEAKKVGFSWNSVSEIYADVLSEIKELQNELESENLNIQKIEDELGDVIYSLCNLVSFFKETRNDASHLDFDLIARAAIDKFINRFFEMEKIMLEKGITLNKDFAKKISLVEWNDLWKQAKKRRYR